jgi:cysteine desulfurase
MNLFKKRVYADAAAATLLTGRSRRELERLLGLYGNPGALHKEGVAAKKELEAARRSVADSIGAHPDEIIFTASGTEANNLAIQGACSSKKGHAITSAIEHQSVLEPLRMLQGSGVAVTELAVNQEGLLDPKAVAEAVLPETSFVSIQLVNSEVGAIQPVREIIKELRRKGQKIIFHTDAAQAPLWLPLRVDRLGVDLLSLDAQKLGGPKGVGALYVRRGTPLIPLLLGGKQESGLRAGTENVALAGAFAVALADAQRSAEECTKKTADRRDYLWAQIKASIPDAILNGPADRRVANNLNISIPGLEAEMAVISLDALGVAASTRSACSAGEEEPSHVIKALGISPELAGTAIRFTLLPDISKSQCRAIAKALVETANRYRR